MTTGPYTQPGLCPPKLIATGMHLEGHIDLAGRYIVIASVFSDNVINSRAGAQKYVSHTLAMTSWT